MKRRVPERRAPAPPARRRGVVRVSDEAAHALRGGHPWVYRDAVERGAAPGAGEVVEVCDRGGVFLGRGLFDPHGAVAVRLLVRDRDRPVDAALVRARVGRASALRERFLPPALTAHRLLNAEGDGLPGATCDRFGDFLVVHLLTPAWEPFQGALLDALEEVRGPAGIYLQRRYLPASPDRPRPGAEHVRGRAAPLEVEVAEEPVRFPVDVTAPLSPGLFPDLREGRALVGEHAAGRRVLNVFSYTGAFTVRAVHGGAAEATSIDVAARSHARARRALELNGLSAARCEFLVGDAIALLARLAARGRRFDLVVIDPPTFAAGKGRPFSVLRDYADLVAAAAAVLDEGGLLAAAANAHRMTVEDFDRACAGGGARAGATLRVVRRVGLPPDFPTLAALPETSYLKFSLLAKP